LAGGVVAAACSSSSPVKPGSGTSASFVLGAHLDTLAVQAAQAGFSDRYRLLSYPIAALMENLVPSSVSVSVDGTTETYQAAVLELVGTTAGSSPTPAESLFVVAAWSDSNADELVFTQVALPDTLEDAEDLSDSNSNGSLDSATVLSVAVTDATGSCDTFTLPLANIAVSDFLTNSTCNTGSATAAFTFYFTPSINPHSVFILNSQPINAVRIVLPANTGGEERLREMGLKRR
jgi:hypothetical protein